MSGAPTIHVRGLGAQTAVGRSAAACAAAVRAGVNRAGEHPQHTSAAGEPLVVAEAVYLGPEASGAARHLALAGPALQEAARPLAEVASAPDSVPLLLGLPAPGPGVPEDLASALSDGLGQVLSGLGINSTTEVFPTGPAGGVQALAAAVDRLHKQPGFCLVGGVDSWIDAGTLAALEQQGRLMTAEQPFGFVPGEGAGFCLLGSGPGAGGEALARVRAAATVDGGGDDGPELGLALTRAWRAALAGLPAPEARVSQVISDFNSEPDRADELALTLTRCGEHLSDPPAVLTPADCWGDLGAASAPLFVALAAMAGARGYARGPLSLLSASTPGGARGALLLELHCRRPGHPLERS